MELELNLIPFNILKGIDSLPNELIESIVYMLDNDSLNNFILSHFELIELTKLNWSTIFLYRFGKYKKVNYVEYYRYISIEKLKSIWKLKHSIDELINLQTLYLDNIQMKEIPKEIGSLINLRELDLYSNQITTIPEEIGSLINLEILNLNNNQIKVIPKEIGSLINLRELQLSSNQIEIIPKEIGSLVNLQYLSLISNKIREVPEEIGLLANLRQLQLQYNFGLLDISGKLKNTSKEVERLINSQILRL